MDKRKVANQQVKDRLLAALVEFAGRKDWPKATVTALVEPAGVARAPFYRNFASGAAPVAYAIRHVPARYHAGKPEGREGFRDRPLVEYKFRFYQEHAPPALAFHRAQAATSLLDLITDCEIACWGDMPLRSPDRYEVYFYAGPFYTSLLCWLEGGTRESPEAITDAFMRLADGGVRS